MVMVHWTSFSRILPVTNKQLAYVQNDDCVLGLISTTSDVSDVAPNYTVRSSIHGVQPTIKRKMTNRRRTSSHRTRIIKIRCENKKTNKERKAKKPTKTQTKRNNIAAVIFDDDSIHR